MGSLQGFNIQTDKLLEAVCTSSGHAILTHEFIQRCMFFTHSMGSFTSFQLNVIAAGHSSVSKFGFVPSCCAIVLCLHVVPTCCALMLYPHVGTLCLHDGKLCLHIVHVKFDSNHTPSVYTHTPMQGAASMLEVYHPS